MSSFGFSFGVTLETKNITFGVLGDCWNLEYSLIHAAHTARPRNNRNTVLPNSCTKFSATFARQNLLINEKKVHVNFCAVKLKYPGNNSILGECTKILRRDDNKFQVDMTINDCVLSYHSCSVKVFLTFGYNPPVDFTSFLSSMKTLWTMQSESTLTDFVIKTKEAEIPCHKVILAARSDYFANMFATQMKESMENVLHWEDVFDQTTVRDLLHFIYTGDKPLNIVETCFSLVEAANMCLLVDLKKWCLSEIICQVKEDNVVQVLVVGEKYDSETLKKSAWNFIVDNFDFKNGDMSQLAGWDQVESEMGKRLAASFMKMVGRKKIKV